MQRFAVGMMALVAVTSCSRNFEAPSIRPLSVAPSFAAVAPRETHAIAIDGGVSPIRLSFQGTPGSGEGASLDGGVYQAGKLGNTQDVVMAEDEQGTIGLATFSVGPPLAFAQVPVGAQTPGTSFAFAATGGKPPYAYSVDGCFPDGGSAPDGGSGATLATGTGNYTAGPVGNAFDCVQVSDATHDPLASAIAVVSVGAGLSLAPSFVQVAPRGRVDFAVSGGVPPFTYSFTRSPESGLDAQLDAGAYQAGAIGLTQDVVQVVDAAGSVRQATVAVGPQLAVTPIEATVAPAGTVQFEASGGQPPYQYAIVQCPNEVAENPGSTVDPLSGVYVAATVANLPFDCIAVSDGTHDPLAQASATVTVGAALIMVVSQQMDIYPPGVQLQFVAFGGQPPYQFNVDAGPSGGSGNAVIDSHTGVYRAGTSGPGVDVVTVIDANQQSYSISLNIGPTLALEAAQVELHPGISVPLAASGGEAPYFFGFAPRGNHTNGVVDATLGVYVPGPNFGAADTLQVTDAAGSTATYQVAPNGPLQISFGNVDKVLAADLNGDGVEDVVLVTLAAWGGPPQRLESIIAMPGSTPRTDTSWWSVGATLGDVLAGDVDGDGHTDLVTFSDQVIGVLRAGSDGTLDSQVTVFSRAQEPDGSFNGSLGFALSTTGGFVQVWVYEPAGGQCGAQAGIVELDFDTGLVTPSPPFCRATVGGSLNSLASGDWNIDGNVDLAWVEVDALVDGGTESDQVHLDFGPFGAGNGSQVVTLPGPQQPGEFGAYTSSQELAALHMTSGGDNLAVMLASTLGVSTQVVEIAAGTPPSLGVPYNVDLGGDAAEDLNPVALHTAGVIDGMSACDGYDGRLPLFVPGDGGTLESVGAPLRYGSQIDGLATPDFNGDGVPDLAFTAGGIGATTIVWGDGDATFGRLAHFRSLATGAIADVDGDGIDDVIALGGQAVQVLFGGGHQLAYGPVTQLAVPPLGVAVGDLDGQGPLDLVAVGNAGGILIYPGLDGGSFGAPTDVQNAAGADFPLINTLSTGEFGGPAAGLDLWTRACDGIDTCTLYFYVRDTATQAHLVEQTILGWQNCVAVHLDLNQDGLDDLVAGCGSNTEVDGGATELESQFLVALSSAPGAQFEAWQDAGYFAQIVGGVTTLPKVLASGSGLASFVSFGAQRRLWFFSSAGEQVLDVTDRFSPGTGVVGAFGPGGALAIAARESLTESVRFLDLLPDAGFAERAEPLDAVGSPFAAIASEPGAPADLFVLAGGDLVVHLNDGGLIY